MSGYWETMSIQEKIQNEKDAFLYFWIQDLKDNEVIFNGKDYKIYRTINNFMDDLEIATHDDKITHVPGQVGSYFFGGKRKPKVFKIPIAFDSLTQSQLAEIVRIYEDNLRKDKFLKLVFNESPYKYYKVQMTDVINFSYMPFEGDEETIYKGTGTLQFTCYEGLAHSEFIELPNTMEDGVNPQIFNSIWGTNFPVAATDAAQTETTDSGQTGAITAENLGDYTIYPLFEITFTKTDTLNSLSIQQKETPDSDEIINELYIDLFSYDSSKNRNKENDAENEAEKIFIDTKANLVFFVEEIDSVTVAQKILPSILIKGDFFLLPPKKVGYFECSNGTITDIKYNYLFI